MTILNIFKRMCIFATGTLLSTASIADVFDISLNNDVAQFYYQPSGNVDVNADASGVQFGLLFNDDSDWMLSGKLLVPSANTSGLQLSPGVKVSLIDADALDSSINAALSIGGRVSALLATAIPLRAYGELYYAPPITSFNDLDNILEIDAGIEYQAANNASIYLGYRRIDVDVEDPGKDIKLDNKLHVGVRLNF